MRSIHPWGVGVGWGGGGMTHNSPSHPGGGMTRDSQQYMHMVKI